MRAPVLGGGSIGARHPRNLASLGVEVIVSDPALDRARSVTGARGASIADRNEASADIAIVATPTIEHPADLEWCLARAMHTFVEKPLAATLEGLGRAVASAGASDRVTMVALQPALHRKLRVRAVEPRPHQLDHQHRRGLRLLSPRSLTLAPCDREGAVNPAPSCNA
jgi:predicted dehydrogenase